MVFHRNRDKSYIFYFTIDLPQTEYNPTIEHLRYAEQMD